MIEKWIDKILTKSSGNPDERSYLIRLAGIVGILANILFAGVKMIVGVAANSVAIISDAVNNLSDAISSVITLIGLKISQHPPDYKHPLGYGRIEYISGMIISALVLATGIEFLITSIKRIISSEETAFTTGQFVVLGAVMIGKWVLSRFHLMIGRKTDSESLIAAGTDAKMDVLLSFMTIAAGIVSKLSGWHIDGYVGVALALIIIYNGIILIRDTVNSIIGERPKKDLAEKLKAAVLKYEPITGAYDLIVHNYGPATRLGSLNLEIPDYITVEKAYETMSSAQHDIYKTFGIYFTFGLYSVNTYDQEIVAMRENITKLVTSFPGVISIHNFYFDKKQNRFRFDVVVGFETRDFSSFRRQITELIQEKYPKSSVIVNMELDYA